MDAIVKLFKRNTGVRTLLDFWTDEFKSQLIAFTQEDKLENNNLYELFVYYNQYYLNRYPQLY